jgi:hypothetical protein
MEAHGEVRLAAVLDHYESIGTNARPATAHFTGQTPAHIRIEPAIAVIDYHEIVLCAFSFCKLDNHVYKIEINSESSVMAK